MDRREALKTGLLAGLAALLPGGALLATEPGTKLGPCWVPAGGNKITLIKDGVPTAPFGAETTFQNLRKGQLAVFWRKPGSVFYVSENRGIPTAIYEGDAVLVPTFDDLNINREIEALAEIGAKEYKLPVLGFITRSDHVKGSIVGLYMTSEHCPFKNPFAHSRELNPFVRDAADPSVGSGDWVLRNSDYQ